MSDMPRFGEVLEGYLELAGQLVKNWTPYVKGVSAELDAGTYDAAADFPTVAKLAADSWLLIGSEAMDAVAILTSDFSEKEIVIGYKTDAQKSGMKRTLTLKGDLVSATKEVLPAGRVKITPAEIEAGATEFTLSFDGDGFKARTYDGRVVATDENGAVKDEVFVSVTIG